MIAFNELFPYDDLMRMLQQLAAEEKKLSTGRDTFSKIYQKSLKDELALITKIRDSLASFKGQELIKAADDLDKLGKKTQGYRDIIATLTSANDANKRSTEDLRGVLGELKKQYEKLDPTQSDYNQRQQELATKSGYVKTAMEGQLSVMKEATRIVKAAENSYNALNKETVQLRTQLKNMPGAFDMTTGAINRQNKAATSLQQQIEQNDRALKAMDASMGLHQRNVGNYTSAFDGLKGALIQFTGIASGVDLAVQAISKSFETLSNFERYRAGLQAAIGSSRNLNIEIDYLDKLASRTGQSIDVLFGSYKSFAASARDTNLSLSEQRRIFTSVIEASSAMRLTNDQTERALNALQQMLSKGNIQAEELRGQLGEALPGAFGLMAKALGVSTSRLNDMLKAGEVLAEDALPKLATELEKTFGKNAQNNVNSVGGSFNRLTNEIKLLLDSLNEKTRITSFFSWFNNGLADTLRGIRNVAREGGAIGLFKVIAGDTFGPGKQFKDFANMPAQKADRYKDLSGFSSLGEKQRESNIFSQAGYVQQLEAYKAKQKIDSEAFYKATDALNKESKLLADMIRIDKELSQSKKAVSSETANETEKVKELRKEMAKLRNELREGEKANKGYAQTEEGAAKSARYATIKKELKAIDVATGISSPAKVKEADTQVEKLVKDLNKLQDILLDDALQDLRNGKAVDLPESVVSKWKELYALLEKLSRIAGVDVPGKLTEFNNQFSRKGLTTPGFMPNGSPIPTAILPNEEMKTALGDKLPGIDKVLNRMREEESERNRLKLSASTTLRGIKREELTELLRIQAELQKAERDGDKTRRDELKEEFAFKKELYREDARQRRQALEESLQLAQTIGQGIFDIQSAYRDKDIAALEKKKEAELLQAGDNKDKQTQIEQKYANKIRDIRQKQARADKAAALFNIYIQTAVATIRAISEGGVFAGIPLAAFVAAQGIAQAAIVAARPIPEFAKGTQYAPEGPALVAEKGPELRKSGEKYYYYDTPTVANLKQGDKIFTASQTADMFRQSMLTASIERQQKSDLRTSAANYTIQTIDTAAMAKSIGKEMTAALKKQPYLKETLDKGQLKTLLVEGDSITAYYGKKYF